MPLPALKGEFAMMKKGRKLSEYFAFPASRTTLLMLLLLILTTSAGSSQESYDLRKALQTARAENPELKTVKYRIRFAETEITAAETRSNPHFTNESIQLIKRSEFAENTGWYRGQNREVFYQIAKPFRVAGQRTYAIEAARENVVSETHAYSDRERDIFHRVAAKWLEIQTAYKQADLLATGRKNIDSLIRANQFRYEKEVITETELFRTELLVQQYRLQQRAARQKLRNKTREMQYLLGRPDSIAIDTAFSMTIDLPDEVDSLIRLAKNERADLALARSAVRFSEIDRKLQKSLSYPQPEVGIVYNPQGAVPFLGFSLGIDLPIFDRNQSEIEKSNVEKLRAKQELFALERSVETEVGILFSDFRLLEDQLRDFSDILSQSQAILENVRYAYLRGGTTIIDFLEAQRSWLETRQEHLDLRQEYLEKYIELLHATGMINQLAQ